MFLVPVTRQSAEMTRLFDDAFERLFGIAPAGETPGARSPALDVTETDKTYVVKLDLPGVKKEDVQVSIEGRRVAVQAQTRHDEEKKEGERVVYRERSMASFARSFTLPGEVDQAESQARLDQGVLTLTLAKRAGGRSGTQIPVN